mgnify:FL=1
MKQLFRKLKRAADPYMGKYLDKFIWRFRHLILANWEDGYLDEQCLEHPHRKMIVNSISKRADTKTILELGTGSGINLVNLSKHFPNISYSGIDINRRAVGIGKKYLKDNNISNIELIADDIFNIKRMKSNSIDIILTDAVLMYLDPKDLPNLLSEMLRISKLGIILCEQTSLGGVYVDHWRHDYEAIINKFTGVKGLTLQKITDEYWDGDWIKFGFLIEVEKELI